MDLEGVSRDSNLSNGRISGIEQKDREPTKYVPRLASDCEGVWSMLSGTHETKAHTSEATRKSFGTR